MCDVSQVLQHFECYREIRELSTLRDQVTSIRQQLATQILADFKEAFTGETTTSNTFIGLKQPWNAKEIERTQVRFLSVRV